MEAAAGAMKLAYRSPASPVSAGPVRLLSLSIKLASKGFSPKASLYGIPEWISLLEMGLRILAKLPGHKVLKKRRRQKIIKHFMDIDQLRKRVSSHGRNTRGLSKAKLVRSLASKRTIVGQT
jgi:hypothetical protein